MPDGRTDRVGSDFIGLFGTAQHKNSTFVARGRFSSSRKESAAIQRFCLRIGGAHRLFDATTHPAERQPSEPRPRRAAGRRVVPRSAAGPSAEPKIRTAAENADKLLGLSSG